MRNAEKYKMNTKDNKDFHKVVQILARNEMCPEGLAAKCIQRFVEQINSEMVDGIDWSKVVIDALFLVSCSKALINRHFAKLEEVTGDD